MILQRYFFMGVLALIFYYLFVLQVQAIWPFTIDDMYIPLRYAKHWAAHQGIVWNIGEPPVEGYSNFLFVISARWALFWHLDPVVILKSLGGVGLLGTCVGVYLLARTWFLPRVALIPCIWLLAYKGQIIWSVSGLETTIYEAVICFTVFFIFKGLGYTLSPLEKGVDRPWYYVYAGIGLSFAGIIRPEAPALALLFIFLLMNQRKAWVLIVTVLVCFAPYFLWRWHYFGRFLPNSVYCKGFEEWLSNPLDKAYCQLIWPFALLSLWAFRDNRDRRFYLLLLPSVVYLFLLMGASPLVAFENRLFLPAFVLMLPLALKGLDGLLGSFKSDVTIYIGSAMILFLCIPTLSLSQYRYFTVAPLAGERVRAQVLSWLSHHGSSSWRVVLADSGFIPYHSNLQFIDSYCLNNARMGEQPSAKRAQFVCEDALQQGASVIILTAERAEGILTYTPADVCFLEKLAGNSGYCRIAVFKTGDTQSGYQYEIFSKSKKSCSKMQQG